MFIDCFFVFLSIKFNGLKLTPQWTMSNIFVCILINIYHGIFILCRHVKSLVEPMVAFAVKGITSTIVNNFQHSIIAAVIFLSQNILKERTSFSEK